MGISLSTIVRAGSPRSPKAKNLTLIAFFLFLGAHFGFAANPEDIDRVASRLSCYCGTCPHLVATQCGCSNAEAMKAEVGKMLDSGMTEQQIIQSFVDRYGNTVLSSPPKSGF